MVLTGGTRGLRLVSVLGVLFAVLGFLLARVWLVVAGCTASPSPRRAGRR